MTDQDVATEVEQLVAQDKISYEHCISLGKQLQAEMAKAQQLALFDQVQAIHDACTAKQNEVEKTDEHDALNAIKASPPADVPTTLAAVEALILNVNAKHAALLKEKTAALLALRAQLV